MTTLGWIGFLVIVLVVACWPLGRLIVRGIIRQRRLNALAVPDAPPPDPREWTPHLDYSGEPMAEGQFRDPPDWRELGRTEWLNAKHMPDRMCRIYPYQDRWSPEDEREFLAGWNEAAAADRLMRDERTPGD